MASNIENEVIRTYDPSQPEGVGAFAQDIQNQQLNDALASGTVDNILLAATYVSQNDYNVVVKRDIQGFVTEADVVRVVNEIPTYDFGDYASSVRRLFIKSEMALTPTVPTTAHLTRRGELAVDNYNATLYALTNAERDSNGDWAALPTTKVAAINAGTVNGYIVEQNVYAGNGNDAMLTREEIKNLINAAFSYDAVTNSLTISQI